MVLETNLPSLKLRARGKVRDIYEDGDRLLIVATDRISAFDYILATGIPDKGRVLTQMTLFWLDFLRDMVPNHFLSTDMSGLPPEFEGRSMWVQARRDVRVECVARGYMSGSGWKDYQRTGAICGIPLPAGLARKRRAARADLHARDQGADRSRRKHFVRAQRLRSIGADLAARLRDLTLAIYKKAADYARTRGIIIADTKFEFGIVERRNHSGGRSPDAGFVALLAARNLYARRRAAFLRQAIRARLSGIDPLEQAAARARACPRMSRAAPAKNTRRPIGR